MSSRAETVRQVLEAHLDSVAEHERFYSRLVIEAPFLPAGARKTFFQIQSAIASRLAEAIEHDIAGGRIRSVPADLAFNTWIGLLHHYLAHRDLFAPRQSVVERCGKRLLDHYLGLVESGS